ncbi:hypothetical protein AVEN_189285-1 [Araneus ventricosus]|uniref:Uncharacterized protein n=1 Tax=Araneus ventricosus TaxID=182803 RepID=A0A4Y2MZZ6_ARAVE|nr:hypothetical protein AVEN_189285-1 [Araneus ventricosus]
MATRCSFQFQLTVANDPDVKALRQLFDKFQRTCSGADELVGILAPSNLLLLPKMSRKFLHLGIRGIHPKHVQNTEDHLKSVSVQGPSSPRHNSSSCTTKRGVCE